MRRLHDIYFTAVCIWIKHQPITMHQMRLKDRGNRLQYGIKTVIQFEAMRCASENQNIHISAKCILFHESCLRPYIMYCMHRDAQISSCWEKWIKFQCLDLELAFIIGCFLFKSWSDAHMDDSNEPRGGPGLDPWLLQSLLLLYF